MSGKKDTLDKQISENFPVTTDFNEVLQSGESLAAGSTVLSYDATGSLLSDGIIINESTIAYSDGYVQVNAISGSLDETYKLSFRGITDLSNTFEHDVFVTIID